VVSIDVVAIIRFREQKRCFAIRNRKIGEKHRSSDRISPDSVIKFNSRF
jgi:hypothetical protein